MEDCEEVRIRPNTLNTSRGQHRTKIVKEEEIFDMDEISSINLSTFYSCRQLPASNQDITAQSDIGQLSEFSEVYILQVKYQIGLLIGNDNRIVR